MSLAERAQLRAIRQLLAASFIDQVAVRRDVYEKTPQRFESATNVPYKAMGVAEDVFIHPSSILYSREPPDYVCFGEVHKTSKAFLKSQSVASRSHSAKARQWSLRFRQTGCRPLENRCVHSQKVCLTDRQAVV